jgi:hypothetical protein
MRKLAKEILGHLRDGYFLEFRHSYQRGWGPNPDEDAWNIVQYVADDKDAPTCVVDFGDSLPRGVRCEYPLYRGYEMEADGFLSKMHDFSEYSYCLTPVGLAAAEAMFGPATRPLLVRPRNWNPAPGRARNGC